MKDSSVTTPSSAELVSSESITSVSSLDNRESSATLHRAQTIEEAIKEGNYALAERKLEQYRLQYGKTPHYLYFLAKAKLGQNEYAEANELFKTLYYHYPVFMADRPDYIEFRQEYIERPLERAKIVWNQILTRLSENDRSVKQKNTANSQTDSNSGGTQSETDQTNKPFQDKDSGLTLQDRTEIKKQIELVAADFQRVLDIEPKHIEALTGLIQCATELGNAEEVLRLKERLETAPSHWEALRRKRVENAYNEARKAFRENNIDLANRILNLGLEVMPEDTNLVLLKGEILLKKQKFKESIACADLVLRKFSNHSLAMRLRSKVLAAKYEFNLSKAQDRLREAEEAQIGSTLQSTKAREALDHFLEALDFDPANIMILSGIYRCHVLLNNPLKAHQTLTRIKELDPQFKIPIPQKQKQAKQDEEFLPEPCFVATRLFGPNSHQTITLRAFRDKYLIIFPAGRLFIAAYRRFGPALASLPGQGPLFPILRILLTAITRFLRYLI